MLLVLQHPEIARIDCDHCQEFFYDFDPQSQMFGQVRTLRNGEPRKRDWSCPPPCRTPKGCPNGTPEQPKRHNETNQRAYEHYKECRATGQFPGDSLVQQNAMLIREIEDACERFEDENFRRSLIKLAVMR